MEDGNLFGEALEDSIPKFENKGEDGLVADKQARWEHRIVGKLLAQYGLAGQSRELIRLCQTRTNQRRLSFEAFKQLNPTFPLWLGFRKKANLHMGKLVEILQKPSGPRKRSKSWMYQLFEDAEAAAPEHYQNAESNFGVVFEFMYAEVGSELIAYRYNGALAPITESTTTITWHVPHADQVITVSSLNLFLDRLQWSPPS